MTVNGDTPEQSAELEAILLDLFRGGEDDDHFTGGISVNTPFGLQLQLAADISDDSDEFVLSSIYRFGRIGR